MLLRDVLARSYSTASAQAQGYDSRAAIGLRAPRPLTLWILSCVQHGIVTPSRWKLKNQDAKRDGTEEKKQIWCLSWAIRSFIRLAAQEVQFRTNERQHLSSET